MTTLETCKEICPILEKCIAPMEEADKEAGIYCYLTHRQCEIYAKYQVAKDLGDFVKK